MSYLNALASSGLTVGLRFLGADHSQRVNRREAVPPPAAGLPAVAAEPAEDRRAVRPAPPPLSPEEMAAGRAEARAQLTAEGALGLLQSGFVPPEAAAQATAEATASGAAPGEAEADEVGAGEEAPDGNGAGDAAPAEGPLKKLTPEEEAEVRKLAQRDQEVKAHEQAHVAASGGLAGSPKYEYQTGPDGRQYAVGGQVSISRGGSSNTDQALREAEAVKRGATAPAQPSSQDLAVAARADADIQELKAKKAQEEREEMEGEGREGGPAPSTGGFGSGLFENASTAFEQTIANGAGLSAQAAGAYAAVKLGFQSAVRPLLARA